MKDMTIKELYKLKYSWSAEIMLNNNKVISIWYTCLPSSQDQIKKIISVSSDYPKYEFKKCDFWVKKAK